MADRHCIFAWTETNAPEGFPGYVNISRDENGKHTITVRSRGNAGRDTAIVEIPPEALESLLCDLAADLYRDDADRLMATPEAEVDAELRRLGIDPEEAARQGKAAVEGALAAIRGHKAGVKVRYIRKPEADKRTSRGDDFAGDAWLDTETGETVYTVVGFDRNQQPTMIVQDGKAVSAAGVLGTSNDQGEKQ